MTSVDLSTVLPEGWENWPEEQLEELLRQLKEQSASSSTVTDPQRELQQYQQYPERFAWERLRQRWWSKQIEIAHAIRDHDRVAVRAGHSVGKTHVLGGIVSWYLHAFQPSTIITTAPSNNQVKTGLWKEIRSQVSKAPEPLLPGLLPIDPMWRVHADWFAQGFATDAGDKFRGTHAAHMLFIFDEATGIPAWAWEEAENMCTSPGNKILAIANPTNPACTFADCFKPDSGWYCIDINCLDHPNVIHGQQIYPGAVSREWVERRVKKFCVEIDPADANPAQDFEWNGRWYKPSASFECRVLGRFPTEGPDILFSTAQIVYARTREPITIDDLSAVDMGLDVAYKGGDACVLFSRRGPCVIGRDKWYGRDPTQTVAKVVGRCKELNRKGLRVGTIAVDAIGIGSGVASALRDLKEEGAIRVERIIAVQVSERAHMVEKYANKRAELTFALSERFKENQIDLTRIGEDANDFELQAPRITWDYRTATGQYRVVEKDKYREEHGMSPDDVDGLMLCFVDTTDTFAERYSDLMQI